MISVSIEQLSFILAYFITTLNAIIMKFINLFTYLQYYVVILLLQIYICKFIKFLQIIINLLFRSSNCFKCYLRIYTEKMNFYQNSLQIYEISINISLLTDSIKMKY